MKTRSVPRAAKALSALGVTAAVVIGVNANVLVSRWYHRWDLTREGLYSLSPATKSILAGLDATIRCCLRSGRCSSPTERRRAS
jgi:hypothetical protein